MKTIRVSDEVWDAIAKEGRFGETPDVVLRRVFKIGVGNSSKGAGPSKRRIANNRMAANVVGEELQIRFASGSSRVWLLPKRDDKIGIRRVRDAAIQFAKENGATDGQVSAVMKALTQNGYHLTK